MIQLKVLGEGANLWHKKPGAYWIKVSAQQLILWKNFCNVGKGDTIGATRAISELGRVARASLVSALADS